MSPSRRHKLRNSFTLRAREPEGSHFRLYWGWLMELSPTHFPASILFRFYADFEIGPNLRRTNELSLEQRSMLQSILASPSILREVGRLSLLTELSGLTENYFEAWRCVVSAWPWRAETDIKITGRMRCRGCWDLVSTDKCRRARREASTLWEMCVHRASRIV